MATGPELLAEDAIAALFRLPLESFTQARNALAASLKKQGLAQASARAKAREAFRDDPADADGWVGQWRRAARHMSQLQADPEELKRAEQALAEDMSEENLQRLQAILDRMRRESMESNAI